MSQVDNFVCQRTCEARSEAQRQRQSVRERGREKEREYKEEETWLLVMQAAMPLKHVKSRSHQQPLNIALRAREQQQHRNKNKTH